MPKPSSLKDQCPIFSTVSWKSWVYLLWYVLDTWVLHKPHPAGLGRQNTFWFKCYRTQGMTCAPLQTPGLEHEVVAPQSTAVPQHMLFSVSICCAETPSFPSLLPLRSCCCHQPSHLSSASHLLGPASFQMAPAGLNQELIYFDNLPCRLPSPGKIWEATAFPSCCWRRLTGRYARHTQLNQSWLHWAKVLCTATPPCHSYVPKWYLKTFMSTQVLFAQLQHSAGLCVQHQ